MAYSTIFNGSKSLNVAQGSSTTQFNNLVEGVLTRITLTSDLTARLTGTCEDDMSQRILKDGTYFVQYTPITKSFELKVNCCVFSGSIKLTVINNAIKCELITEFKQSKPVDGIGWEITGGITITKIENDPDAEVELIWSGHNDSLSILNGTFNVPGLVPGRKTTYVFSEGLECSSRYQGSYTHGVLITSGDLITNSGNISKNATLKWESETIIVAVSIDILSNGSLASSVSYQGGGGCWSPGDITLSGSMQLTEIYQSLYYDLTTTAPNATITVLKNGTDYTGNKVKKGDKLTISASANPGYQLLTFKVKHGVVETNWTSGQTLIADGNIAITVSTDDIWFTTWSGSLPLRSGGTFNIPELVPERKTKYIFSDGLSVSMSGYYMYLGSATLIPAGENVAANSTLSASASFTEPENGTATVSVTVKASSANTLTATHSCNGGGGCWSNPTPNYIGNLTLTRIEQASVCRLTRNVTNATATVLKNGVPVTGSEVQAGDVLAISASANPGYQLLSFKVIHNNVETNWTNGQTLTVKGNVTIIASTDDEWDTVWTGNLSLRPGGTFSLLGLIEGIKTKYVFSDGLSVQMYGYSSNLGTKTLISAGEHVAANSTLSASTSFTDPGYGTATVSVTVKASSANTLAATYYCTGNDGGCWYPSPNYIGNLTLIRIEQSRNAALTKVLTNATVTVLKNGTAYTGNEIKKGDVLTISASANTDYQLQSFKVKNGSVETDWTNGQSLTVNGNVTVTAAATETWQSVWNGSLSLRPGGTFNIPGLVAGKKTKYVFSDNLSVQMNGYSSNLGTKTLISAGEYVAANSTLSASTSFTDPGYGTASVSATIKASSANTLTATYYCTGNDGGCWYPSPNYIGNLTLTAIYQW